MIMVCAISQVLFTDLFADFFHLLFRDKILDLTAAFPATARIIDPETKQAMSHLALGGIVSGFTGFLWVFVRVLRTETPALDS